MVLTRVLVALALVLGLGALTPAQAAHHRSECQKTVARSASCSTVQVFGHRGRHWRHATNENTLLAFDQDRKLHTSFEADAWVLADGRAVVFHDQTLGRVVDPFSMPAGVSSHTKITDLTTAQFRQLRTKGGQPLLTLKHLIRFAGRRGVSGMIENKYALLDPAQVSGWIKQFHAPVVIYQTPKCHEGQPDRPTFLDYGIAVGAKYLGSCMPTPEQLAAAGFTFVITREDQITAAYVDAAHAAGLKVGNFDSGKPDVWARLVSAGADYLLAPHPGKARAWLGQAKR